MMRLKPIENPNNLLVKLAFWWSRREFGKVIMPMKIIYARKPKLMWLANKIYKTQEKNFTLDETIKLLIQTQVSALNGCAFCNDISLAQAIKKGLGAEKFLALGADSDAEKTKVFSAKEQSVIAFVNEYAKERKVSDETFERLRSHFTEEEIIEIVAMNAFEQYFNAFAVPLGLESDGLRRLAENERENKKILEYLFAVNAAAPPMEAEFMSKFDTAAPNFRLVSGEQITGEFLSRGLSDFHAALNFVWRLAYGRNSNRGDFNLVLKESRGTCSTKHALLTALAAEQNRQVFLNLGIYEMNARNTPSVGEVLDEFGLKSLPEAHCYLTYQKKRIDITRFSDEKAVEPIENFMYEERIRPAQIGGYKLRLHRRFFQNWIRENNLSEQFSFERLWSVREKCIASLAQ